MLEITAFTLLLRISTHRTWGGEGVGCQVMDTRGQTLPETIADLDAVLANVECVLDFRSLG